MDARVAAGLGRDGGEAQLTDELIGQVVAAVRPDRQRPRPRMGIPREQGDWIANWVRDRLTVIKIGDLLARGE